MIKNKNLKVVDPKKRVTVYGTGGAMEKGVAYKVGEQLAEKLVATERATLTKPTAAAKEAPKGAAPAAPKA